MPITNAEAPLSNITVTGQPFIGPAIGGISSVGFAQGFSGQRFSISLPTQYGFIAPVLPSVLEEIISVGPRLAPGAATGAGVSISAGAMFLLGALGVGYMGKKIVEEIVQNQLDEQIRTQEANEEAAERRRLRRERDEFVRTFPLGDRPDVETETETVPFTPQRPQIAPPVVLPNPDADPFFMPETQPRVLPISPRPVLVPLPLGVPLPLPLVSPQTRPIGIPAPLPLPTALPLPFALPGTFVQPFALPFADPLAQPFADPVAQPFSSPLTDFRPVGVDSPLNQPFAQPFASPFAMPEPDLARAECPPCKKDQKEDEARMACYKKLVKEARYSVDDTSYNWVQIDCDTGKEL